jgi:hypothetical protein
MMFSETKTKREDNHGEGWTLCARFLLLCGVLLIGAGFVSWDLVHDQPKPLPARVS